MSTFHIAFALALHLFIQCISIPYAKQFCLCKDVKQRAKTIDSDSEAGSFEYGIPFPIDSYYDEQDILAEEPDIEVMEERTIEVMEERAEGAPEEEAAEEGEEGGDEEVGHEEEGHEKEAVGEEIKEEVKEEEEEEEEEDGNEEEQQDEG